MDLKAALDSYDDYGSDVMASDSDNFVNNLQSFLSLLAPDQVLGPLIGELLPSVDFEIWYSTCLSKAPAEAGSGELDWPEQIDKRVALRLQLLRRIASRTLPITHFCLRFCWAENNLDSNIRKFSSQVFRPFHRDLRRMLQAAGETPPAAESDKAQISLPAGDPYRASKLFYQLLKQAKRELLLSDPYLDEAVFPFIESLDRNVGLRLLTGNKKPIFPALLKAFQRNRPHVESRRTSTIHGRFLILDGTRVWSLGTSINGLGEKLDIASEVLDPTARATVIAEIEAAWAAAVAVIEERVRQSSAVVARDTPAERAARMSRDAASEAERYARLHGEEGVAMATAEMDRLVQSLREETAKVSAQMPLQFKVMEVRGRPVCVVSGFGVSLSVGQEIVYLNSLDGSCLGVVLWKGSSPYGRDIMIPVPTKLKERELRFDLGPSGEPGWREAKGEKRFLTTATLAEECLAILLDGVEGERLRRRTDS